MVRGNQCVARECYSASMKQKMVNNIYMDELDMRDEVSTRPAPSEELEPVQLDDQLKHLVYIGSQLAKDVRSLLIHFLKAEHGGVHLEAGRHGQNRPGSNHPQVERQSVFQADQAKKKELRPRKAEGD